MGNATLTLSGQPSAAERQRAARFVASRAKDVADLALLLGALGLADVPRQVPRKPGRPRQSEHGSGGYQRGCRCEVCREANRVRCAEQRARRGAESADLAGHGSPSTYQNHGCRCERCTAAHTEKMAARRAKRPPRNRRNPAAADRAGHGKVNTYKSHGCRCPECKRAMAAYAAEYNAAHRKPKVYGAPKSGVRHGYRTTYQHYGCRCQVCCEANAAYQRAYKERRGQKAGAAA